MFLKKLKKTQNFKKFKENGREFDDIEKCLTWVEVYLNGGIQQVKHLQVKVRWFNIQLSWQQQYKLNKSMNMKAWLTRVSKAK